VRLHTILEILRTGVVCVPAAKFAVTLNSFQGPAAIWGRLIEGFEHAEIWMLKRVQHDEWV
tara:strand:- start:367 stop:549 length:183 start_codon:yes stop_codon:yes gene_type:complete